LGVAGGDEERCFFTGDSSSLADSRLGAILAR
jgi:hypothetical protein